MNERDRVKAWQEYWWKIGASYNSPWSASSGMQMLSKLEEGFIRECINFLPDKGSYNLLDIGIGTGRILDVFVRKEEIGKKFDKAGVSIYGVDYARGMVEFCKKKYRDVPYVKELRRVDLSKEGVPFEQQMDLITAVRVLKYIPRWKKSIRNMILSLGGEGVIVLTMPNKISINRFARLPGQVERITVGEMANFLEDEGLEVVKVSGFSILPDSLYMLSNSRFYLKAVRGFDRLLLRIFGPTLFTRILFFCARRACRNDRLRKFDATKGS